MMDPKTKLMYRLGAYSSGLVALAVIIYGIGESIATTGGGLAVGQSLVAVDWPLPPY